MQMYPVPNSICYRYVIWALQKHFRVVVWRPATLTGVGVLFLVSHSVDSSTVCTSQSHCTASGAS